MDEAQIIALLKQGAVVEQIERGGATYSYGGWQINGETVDDVETEVLLNNMAFDGKLERAIIEKQEYVEHDRYRLPDWPSGHVTMDIVRRAQGESWWGTNQDGLERLDDGHG